MTDKKHPVDDDKPQGLGAGAGAVAGAMAGAAVGAPGGPIGMAVGAVAGGVIGAGAGGALAQTADIEDYREHLMSAYTGAAYHRPGREWDHYEPAYQFAFDHFEEYHGQPMDAIESDLRKEWDTERAIRPERDDWAEARPAVAHGWDYLREQARAFAAAANDARAAGLE